MSDEQQFRPVGELNELASEGVVIDRRTGYWPGQLVELVDRVIDDAETVYLVEDGRRVAMIVPVPGTDTPWTQPDADVVGDINRAVGGGY